MSKKYVLSPEDDDFDYDDYSAEDVEIDDADDSMYHDFDSDSDLDELDEDDDMYEEDTLFDEDEDDIDDEKSEARRDMWSNMDWDKD
jgi:ribonuclease E